MRVLNLIVTLAKEDGGGDSVTAGETGRGDVLSPLQFGSGRALVEVF